MTKEPKVPISFRCAKELAENLDIRAGRNVSTKSALIERAVASFLEANNETTERVLTAQDLKDMTPVLEAMDTGIPISMFLELLDIRHKKES